MEVGVSVPIFAWKKKSNFRKEYRAVPEGERFFR